MLCSLQMGMMEKHVEPDADAARQLMSNEYRDMRNASGRNLRDFIIMRDYINLLEYIQQIFHHFQETRSESSWMISLVVLLLIYFLLLLMLRTSPTVLLHAVQSKYSVDNEDYRMDCMEHSPTVILLTIWWFVCCVSPYYFCVEKATLLADVSPHQNARTYTLSMTPPLYCNEIIYLNVFRHHYIHNYSY